MPRIRRPKITHVVDPVAAGNEPGAEAKEPLINIAGSLSAATPIGIQRFIELAERFIPEENLAEAIKSAAPWINPDSNGKLMSVEAQIIQVALISNFALPGAFKSLRRQFRISQQEIADACNIKQYRTVLEWENGQTSIPQYALSTLSNIVGEKTLQIPMTGNDIAYLRKKWKLSQARLAEIIGVAPLTIFNWEKRGALPVPKSASTKVRDAAQRNNWSIAA
jgi:DNA-binding transcriptional regulator YiaG